MRIAIPDYCLVVLIGASGAGKSTFAAKHFAPTEVISSDTCRAWVSDDANDQTVTADAFDVLHYIVRKRLAGRRLTVVDATNVRPEDRAMFVRLAREYHAHTVALVLDLPQAVCEARNAERPDRQFGSHVVRGHVRNLRRSIRRLRREGFRYQFHFKSEADVDAANIERQPLWSDKRQEHGPFDIIGDIHGCFDELTVLLDQLGYEMARTQAPEGDRFAISHPEGRRLVFLGDLVDRGPNVPDCLRLAMDAVDGGALCVPGNHENKLLRKLRGRNVQVTHGLAETIEQLANEPPAFSERVAAFINGLVSHYVLDDGKLVVAHAGMKAEMQNRSSGVVRSFALYGETSGETDEFGLPVRYDWAAGYRGDAHVVYGHTPVPEAEWLNRTICIDTGCVFGGRLTALRYPEKTLVSVPAAQEYAAPVRPLNATADGRSAQQQHDEILDMDDVRGKRFIATRLRGTVTIREQNAAAALEVMSRFAVDPRWLIYLPPTMSPAETSALPGLLEHPQQAFDYYRAAGVTRAICEEKHMGSRAIAVVCRDEDAAEARFGVPPGEGNSGALYTRTGRRAFDHDDWESTLLERLRSALAAQDFWRRFETDWVCLDCELMPWSAKAKELLAQQYLPVAAASGMGLAKAVDALTRTSAHGIDVADLLARYSQRKDMATAYAASLQHYAAPAETLADVRLAPFHLLATEGTVHTHRDHGWHMATLAELCAADEKLLTPTQFKTVELEDEASVAEATAWWEHITAAGSEGMVVKPWDFAPTEDDNPRHRLQPALKCRGREYLRIIYGPEYTAEDHLSRLRQRGLGAKRSLALREFALGIEGLERFVRREPLRRVHECAFGVLALESEPVDPRL